MMLHHTQLLDGQLQERYQYYMLLERWLLEDGILLRYVVSRPLFAQSHHI